jgi:membrane-bound lytic murein transglycosylase B
MDRLIADGVGRERIVRTFADPRMGPFTGLEFSLSVREPRSLYRRFLGSASLAALRGCRSRFAELLDATQRETGVPATVIASILHVESGCGRNTGSSPVLYRLARLAMASEPENLAANLERYTDDATDAASIAAWVRARAETLTDTFYPEVVATFEVADRLRIDPLTLEGSPSGAFGAPQFLPRSYLLYGVDGDADGYVRLDDMSDATASCGRFLQGHGWRPGLSRADRRAVIWQYNHSDTYVDTILALADRLERPPEAVRVAKRTRRARRPSHGRGG